MRSISIAHLVGTGCQTHSARQILSYTSVTGYTITKHGDAYHQRELADGRKR